MKKIISAWTFAVLMLAGPAYAGQPPTQMYGMFGTVSIPVQVTSDGKLVVSASITPSGTQDVNITKVGGNAVTTTVPVSGTVTSTPGTGTFTNRSGTVATGGTSQTLAAANSARLRLIVENPCAQTESLFINFTSAASTTAGSSIELAPCGAYDSAGAPVSSELITVTAATTSHPFIAKEM